MEKQEKIEKHRASRMQLTVVAVLVGLACGGAFIYNKRTTDELSDGSGGGGMRVKKHVFDKAPITDGSKEELMKSKIVQRPPPPQEQQTTKSEQELSELVQSLDGQVRDVKIQVEQDKATGFMETDPRGVAITKKLQDATRELLHVRYGPNEPYRVQLDLTFQSTIPDFEEKGPTGKVVFEMGPSKYIPHSIFSFLEIARHWKKGAFHRRANHVLQVMVQQNPVKHLAFQEYSDQFPHVKGTVGYAGRPSGPAFYISIQDNARNHGPGSQQKRNPYEADAAIGTVVEGFEDVVLERITKMPGHEFLNDPKKHVLIDKMTILVPSSTGGGYVEWKPTDATTD